MADGKHYNQLNIATVIFDDNGNYLTNGGKIVELRLLDSAFERWCSTGLTVKSGFELKPGKYLIRQVVRDSEELRWLRVTAYRLENPSTKSGSRYRICGAECWYDRYVRIANTAQFVRMRPKFCDGEAAQIVFGSVSVLAASKVRLTDRRPKGRVR
jgi:hypothetical protein